MDSPELTNFNLDAIQLLHKHNILTALVKAITTVNSVDLITIEHEDQEKIINHFLTTNSLTDKEILDTKNNFYSININNHRIQTSEKTNDKNNKRNSYTLIFRSNEYKFLLKDIKDHIILKKIQIDALNDLSILVNKTELNDEINKFRIQKKQI